MRGLAIAAVIIVLVLLITSRSYAELPVMILTFASAALLNMGTNFWFGTISFISNSVTVVLQLALAIDYAIILLHRFTEERQTCDTRQACINAVSYSIPAIASSSLTTSCATSACPCSWWRWWPASSWPTAAPMSMATPW